VSTKRTILSPFTKEYRVLATISSIHQFLEGSFLFVRGSHNTKAKNIQKYKKNENVDIFFSIWSFSLAFAVMNESRGIGILSPVYPLIGSTKCQKSNCSRNTSIHPFFLLLTLAVMPAYQSVTLLTFFTCTVPLPKCNFAHRTNSHPPFYLITKSTNRN